MIAALLPLLLAGQAAETPVALCRDHPALTRDGVTRMTPAAVGDALLAPGHPPIVEANLLPKGPGWPTPPPNSPVLLDIELVPAATFDGASGFCTTTAWSVRTLRPGATEGRETITEQRLYRLPARTGPDRCAAPVSGFFAPQPAEVDRALQVVRLIAAASRHARHVGFPITVDDQENREMAAYQREHPDGPHFPVEVITDPRQALAALPVSNIGYVGHAGDRLFKRAELVGAGERPGEDWQLYAGDGYWTVHVALDGDRIVAMRLRRRVPPPF